MSATRLPSACDAMFERTAPSNPVLRGLGPLTPDFSVQPSSVDDHVVQPSNLLRWQRRDFSVETLLPTCCATCLKSCQFWRPLRRQAVERRPFLQEHALCCRVQVPGRLIHLSEVDRATWCHSCASCGDST